MHKHAAKVKSVDLMLYKCHGLHFHFTSCITSFTWQSHLSMFG